MTAFLYIVAFLVFGAALIVWRKNTGAFDSLMLWGKIYPREKRPVKAQVDAVNLYPDGGGNVRVLIPAVNGAASVALDDKRIEMLAERMPASESEEKANILLTSMEIGKNEYVVSVPSGKKLFLADAKVAKSKEQTYSFKDLSEIEARITKVLYNRNALLICAVVSLFFNPLISTICSAISIYITVKNREFTKVENSDIIWSKVEPNPIQAKADNQYAEGRRLSNAEMVIMNVAAGVNNAKHSVCKGCGCLVDDDWQFCPQCGRPITDDDLGEITEDVYAGDDDFETFPEPIQDEDDFPPIQDEDSELMSDEENPFPDDEFDPGDMSEDGDGDEQPVNDDEPSFVEDDESNGEPDIETADSDDIEVLPLEDDGFIEADFRDIT